MAFRADDNSPRFERILTVLLFVMALVISVVGVHTGWTSFNLQGEEFRQTQTAISTYFIHKDHNFSPAYPTPVLGKPWSIPMEFPLYQWTVAGWMNLTGMELTQSGRLVSAVCFYLTLPGVFLLLGQMGVERVRRLMVLGLILCCPLYMFYTRGFLIETMALMGSVWFLVAFIAAVSGRHRGWSVVANLAGLVAGLVKVTTFMVYLMPAGILALWWLWRARSGRRDLLAVAGWVAGCCLLPFVATVWWTHYADTVKALNPAGAFLQSDQLKDFNLGTNATRFAADIWLGHWKMISFYLIWIPAVAICGVGLLAVKRPVRFMAVGCFLLFMAAQVLFPMLYAFHGYYYVANGILLMMAMGLVLTGLPSVITPRWLAYAAIIAVFIGQSAAFFMRQYPSQRLLSLGGSGLTAVLKHVTGENDVLIVAGDDWSSLTPYYARRRALMVRPGAEWNEKEVDAYFEKLRGEKIGAVILAGKSKSNKRLLEKTTELFDIDPRPLLEWRDTQIYFPRADWKHVFVALDDNGFDEVRWMPGMAPPVESLPTGKVIEYTTLTERQKKYFVAMQPRPVRIYSEFGSGLGVLAHRRIYGMHPDSHLWFRAPAGNRRIEGAFVISPDAYQSPNEKTDGVLLTITLNLADGTVQKLLEQFYDPANWPDDRGFQPIKIEVDVPDGAEIEVSTGAGPRGNKLRDWASLSDFEIK